MVEELVFADNYKSYLVESYESRLQRNPSYSMRAFARDLGMGVSTLSEVLSGKYGLSKRRIAQVVTALQLSAEQAQHFADLVQKEHARKEEDRGAAQQRVISRVNFADHSVSLDSFKLISDWYHFPILELFEIPGYANDLPRAANRLGISEKTIEEAVERLQRLGLLEATDGGFRVTDDFSSVGDETPSQAIRKYHTQMLEKAIMALETKPLSEREVSTNVFTINKKDVPEAKKKIIKFRRELTVLLSKSENPDDVYCLGMQFFSLLNKEN